MSWCIYSFDHKAWLAEDGGHTRDRRDAKQFATREAAEQEVNEEDVEIVVW